MKKDNPFDQHTSLDPSDFELHPLDSPQRKVDGEAERLKYMQDVGGHLSAIKKELEDVEQQLGNLLEAIQGDSLHVRKQIVLNVSENADTAKAQEIGRIVSTIKESAKWLASVSDPSVLISDGETAPTRKSLKDSLVALTLLDEKALEAVIYDDKEAFLKIVTGYMYEKPVVSFFAKAIPEGIKLKVFHDYPYVEKAASDVFHSLSDKRPALTSFDDLKAQKQALETNKVILESNLQMRVKSN